jgi:hypothetical protein
MRDYSALWVVGPPCRHCGSDDTSRHVSARALGLPTWCLACGRPFRCEPRTAPGPATTADGPATPTPSLPKDVP